MIQDPNFPIKKINKRRNDVTCKKKYRFSKKQKGIVLITVGVHI